MRPDDAHPIDEAVEAYIWGGSSATPGRHPEHVEDEVLRARVTAIVIQLDSIRPGDDARDLAAWAERGVGDLAARHPDLGARSLRALTALLSWTWR